MTAVSAPLLGRLTADRACRHWVAAITPDLSAVDGSRALAVGRRVASCTALLAYRHQHVLLAAGAIGQVAVVPGGVGRATVRVDRRELLEVEPEIDGRFDLVLAVDAVHRSSVDDIVLPHLGWLVAPGGHLLIVDPVGQADWPAVRRRYLGYLPGARIDEVQAELMGTWWERPSKVIDPSE